MEQEEWFSRQAAGVRAIPADEMQRRAEAQRENMENVGLSALGQAGMQNMFAGSSLDQIKAEAIRQSKPWYRRALDSIRLLLRY